MIDGGDIRRRGRDGNAEILLDQMLGEGCGMGGAAARTGDDDDWRPADKPGDKLAKRRAKLPSLLLHDRRRLVEFSGHSRARRPHRATVLVEQNSHATCAKD